MAGGDVQTVAELLWERTLAIGHTGCLCGLGPQAGSYSEWDSGNDAIVAPLEWWFGRYQINESLVCLSLGR